MVEHISSHPLQSQVLYREISSRDVIGSVGKQLVTCYVTRLQPLKNNFITLTLILRYSVIY